MFDYQAGEKYKLTLIMVGVAGVMVGVFFTLLLGAGGESPQPRGRHGAAPGSGPRVAPTDPGPGGSPRHQGMRDNGVPRYPDGTPMKPPGQSQTSPADKEGARELVWTLLPLMWDFNSVSANQSQEQAMGGMTPECATNYRTNVWTQEVAQGVAGAAMTSQFTPTICEAYTTTEDGSVVIKVEGDQVLTVQGQQRPKHVNMEYLVKKTNQGLKICGISESGG